MPGISRIGALLHGCAEGNIRVIYSAIKLMASSPRPLLVKITPDKLLSGAANRRELMDILVKRGITDRIIRGKIFQALILLYQSGDYISNSCFMLDRIYQKALAGAEVDEEGIRSCVVSPARRVQTADPVINERSSRELVAEWHEEAGRFPAAGFIFNELAKLAGKNNDKGTEKRHWINTARNREKAEQWKEAGFAYGKASEREEDKEKAKDLWLKTAENYSKVGHYLEVAFAYNKAAERETDRAKKKEYWRLSAEASASAHRPSEAGYAYGKAAELAGRAEEAALFWELAARSFFEAGMPNEAEFTNDRRLEKLREIF